ncbi:Alpha/Beta hydrolase protein [Fennellomyces sp. T-0311]|nr:Alpha/Beta hydrolase protein [Fennellomyces sp. T-0311]
MARLTPTETFHMPVHPATEGHEYLRLAVDLHKFPAASHPVQGSIAFFWAHGTGFHKELLHPLMRRLINELRSTPIYNNIDIDFISWDMRNHGDSARLNCGLHNSSLSWYDLALDTVYIAQEMSSKKVYDKMIGVGHSVGAASLLLAEFVHPRTFDALCPIDPLVRNKILDSQSLSMLATHACTLKRRDTWKDRETCYNSISKRPFWETWNPEALENFIEYGLYDNEEEGNVKLKCPKEQENLIYVSDRYDSFTCFSSLKMLSIPVRVLLCEDRSMDRIARASIQDISKQSPMITVSLFEGSHMVPLEQPEILVPEIKMLTEQVCRNMRSSNHGRLLQAEHRL